MSLPASPSHVTEEDRARRVASLLAGSLELDGVEGAWQHRRQKSTPFITSYPGPGFQEHDAMDVPMEKPARIPISAAHALQLPLRPRLNSEHTPRVNTAAKLSAGPNSISTSQGSTNSPVKPSQVAFRMRNSTASSSERPDSRAKDHRPPSNSDMGSESRRVRPGSASELEWGRIQKLRVDNWSLRSQIHEMRSNLREKQRAKSEADDILFRRMTVEGLGVLHGHGNLPSTGQKTLKELMADCQAARDAYGPLEDDCNKLEDQLSGQEFELYRLEEHFYSQPQEPIVTQEESPVTPAPFDDYEPFSSSVDEEFEELEYHPQVLKYLSRLGDLDLQRERLVDLIDEKRSLEEEREKRLRFGLTLDPEDQGWLENAQTSEDELTEKIRMLEKDLEAMKQECLSLGLVDEYGEPTSFQSQEQGSFNGEEDMNPQDQKSEYVKYPLLLPHPGVKQWEFEGYEPKPDEKSDPTTSRINEWMLQQLRMSALDVNLLARTFQAIFGEIDDEWQIHVLTVWYNDGTMKSAGSPRHLESVRYAQETREKGYYKGTTLPRTGQPGFA